MTTDSDRPKFVIHKHDGKLSQTIENPKEFAALISEEIFAAFLKCFRGVDQIRSIEGLMKLEADYLRGRSVSSNRVGTMLGFMMLSTLYEMGAALQELCNHKIYERITDKSKWEPLNELRGQWNTDKVAGKYRNQFGFHLGDLAFYQKGLAQKLASGAALEFAQGDGTKAHDWTTTLATDALLTGMGIMDEEVLHILTKTSESHMTLPNHLYVLWCEVLDTAGIELVIGDDFMADIDELGR